jgi:Carbohydrate-selective porin, OprB family
LLKLFVEPGALRSSIGALLVSASVAKKLGACGSRCGSVSPRKRARTYLAVPLLVWLPFAASAQEDKKTDEDKPADPDTGESTVEEKTLGILPNPLVKYGVKFAATYIGEVLGNVSGGLKQGAIYEGRLNLAVDVDLQKLAGLNQLTFHANMFQIHGEGLSRDNLQNFFVVSGIEALSTTRLYEAYFEKKWGNNAVSLKAGQLAADSEFFNTKYTDVLTNASMGWPAITSVDLPSGGPSPPLAALGARLLVNVGDNLSVLGGVTPGPMTRSSATAMVSIFVSTTRLCCWDKFNIPGTTKRAIPIWQEMSSSAAGGISPRSVICALHRTASRSPVQRVAAHRRC